MSLYLLARQGFLTITENIQHSYSRPTLGGQPSTVLQVEPDLRIIRQGAIPLVAIQEILGNGQ